MAVPKQFSWQILSLLLLVPGVAALRAGGDVLTGIRPIQGFKNEGSSPRTYWAATKMNSGGIVASGSGLIEFRNGSWSQCSAEGAFDWYCLAGDSKGRVWAAAKGELGVYEPDPAGVLHYRSLTALLPEGARDIDGVWEVFPDENGRTIYVGAGRVVRTDGRNAETWTLPFKRRLYGWIDRGEVFIGGAEGRVYLMAPDGPRLSDLPTGLSGTDIGWIESLGGGSWFALTEAGLFSDSVAVGNQFEPLNSLLRKSAPVSQLRTRDGRLAISTYYSGVILVDTQTGEFEQISEEDGLLSACVNGLIRGEGDWLWAATTRGLNRISTSKAVTLIRNGGGVDGAMVSSVHPDGDSVVVSTQSGRFEISMAGESREPRKLSHLWFDGQARYGSKLLGGSMQGLYEVTQEGTRLVCPDTKDVTDVIVPAAGGNFIFYSAGSSVHAVQEVGGAYAAVASEHLGATIEDIAEDSEGDLWATTSSSVIRLSFAASGNLFVLRRNFPIAVQATEPAQELKLIQVGGSVFLIRDGSLLGLDAASGEFEPIQAFRDVEFVDATGSPGSAAWALARPVRHRADSPRLVRIEFENGALAANEVEASGLLSLGALRNVHEVNFDSGVSEIWIGANGGIVRLNPSLAESGRSAPILNLTMSQNEGGASSEIRVDKPRIPSASGSLAFTWSAPEIIPGDLLIETRIVGAEVNWVPAGSRAERDFTGLGDGSYVFEVRVVDALGRPGPLTSKAFTVLPPWYRTPAAISSFCVTALAFGWIGWQLRMRASRRRAEELEGLVEDRTRELERVNAEKTRFIARMNHEIRNPLNGLLGAIGILEQYSHRGREGRMVHILRACADHLGAVVEDVLDFSSIEGGRVVVQDRAVSIAAILEAVPRMLQAESERSGTEVITTIAPEVPAVVITDPDRIRQILMNFVGNALKYAPGEPVHVEVTATSLDGAPWLRFAVRDHGPGISEADKQMLFSMFERGKGAPDRNARGMGIGLATCRLLARRMGGEVGVISGLGEGSEFFVRLPLKVESGSIPLPETQPQTGLFKVGCLIVEDQEFNRVILKDMLDRFGCKVDEAPNAETALRLAAMNRYDVVFTDLELPDAAPGEILNMLQNQQSAANTPVPALVVTTAYATENVRQTCLDAGAAAFLAKPLSPSKVLAVLREIDAARRPAPAVVAPTQELVAETENVLVTQLARIRGSSVESVASEIAGNIADEVRLLRASVSSENSRETAHHAHRLLSLSALAITPELAGVAAGIQHDAREGRLPGEDRLAALDAAMIAAKEKLSAIKSGAAAGAQSRAPGRSEPTASSHSD